MLELQFPCEQPIPKVRRLQKEVLRLPQPPFQHDFRSTWRVFPILGHQHKSAANRKKLFAGGPPGEVI